MHFLDRFGFRLHHLLSVRSWENYFPFLHLISSNHKKMELMTSHLTWASPTAQQVNNPPAMQEMRFDPWVGKIPGEEKDYPVQYSGLENSMDCIVLGGRKESDMTEQLSLSSVTDVLCYLSMGWWVLVAEQYYQ